MNEISTPPNYRAKRVGNLYPLIYDIDNLREAIRMAAKGKKRRKNVQNILKNVDHYASELQRILINRSYVPSPYRVKEMYDGIQRKKRTIAEPKFFPDQCIHHALIQVLEKVLMRGMYEFSCGSIPGRGTHRAKKYIEKWIRKDPKHTKYVLKMDVRKFYPSISHDVLKARFRRIIKDQKTLWLIDSIVDSYSPGVPIGNYTSQWFCNFMLQDLDHFIKEQLHVEHMVRYVDDMICFSSSKRRLHKARIAIEEKLHDMRLEMKDNWQVFPIKNRFLDFLGFKFYRDKTTIRKSICLRIRRKAKKISRMDKVSPTNAQAMVSYLGWIKHSDSRHFWNVYVRPHIRLNRLKEVIRNESRKQYQTQRQVQNRSPCPA
ncbi:MAG: reverse transcriptase domain-containing protein [Faecalibacterium sp.]